MKNNSLKKFSTNKEKNIESYVEIYIEEDGKLIFTPLTKSNLNFFRKISGNKELKGSIYCG
jgi:hypothetical protein